ncbi:aryl-alcohol dehydrogenase-like predicted oxidoreductase [Elusimicrobium posterum]|uniref:aldo/keto reductase n=1 Tax=Elusimicrobium posterum TaxID=3116653 RepID=UPI003C73E561
MHKVKFERAGWELSPIALGTWIFGGGKEWGAAVREQEAVNVMRYAVDLGVNIIDTAPAYGLGRAEDLTGRALEGRRDRVILATKCGLLFGEKMLRKNLKGESIEYEIEASLRRLKTDYIDLYQTHWPDPEADLADTYGTLLRLKEQGKIRQIGVSNVSLELLKQIEAICPVACVQNEYSFFKPEAGEEVFNYCEQNGIGFLAYGSLAGGILTGKYETQPTFAKSDVRSFFYRMYRGEKFDHAANAVKRFKEVAAKYERPASAVALAWAAATKPFIVPIAGARNKIQLEQNAQVMLLDLKPEDISYLNGN